MFLGLRMLHDEGAQAGGALQLLDPVPDIVQVDHRDAPEAGGIGAAAPGRPPCGRSGGRRASRCARERWGTLAP
jgi:hypothetical protein